MAGAVRDMERASLVGLPSAGVFLENAGSGDSSIRATDRPVIQYSDLVASGGVGTTNHPNPRRTYPYAIRLRAPLRLRPLLTNACHGLPPPLDRPNVVLCGYGRAALSEGLRALNLSEGDNVLVPSLLCASVLAPFKRQSIDVRFYELDQSLGSDLSDAAQKVDSRTRGFLAVNYFGFPQNYENIAAFCAERNLYLIEDNAHGFLSAQRGQCLGTFGDISIFSMRKTLGVPNGAALVINNGSLTVRSRECGFHERPHNLLKFFVEIALEQIGYRIGVELVTPLRRWHKRLSMRRGYDEVQETDTETFNHCAEKWSRFSDRLIRRFPFENARETRRGVFCKWQEWFKRADVPGVRPLFTELPEGVVPLVFPVVGERCHVVHAQLRSRNIEAGVWPTPPARPRNLCSGILVLPVHTMPSFLVDY